MSEKTEAFLLSCNMPTELSFQHGLLTCLLLLLNLFLLSHVWIRPGARRLRGVSHQRSIKGIEIAAYPPSLCGEAIINGPFPNIQQKSSSKIGKRVYYDVTFSPQCVPLWRESEWTPSKMEQFRQLDLLQSRMIQQIASHWQHTLPLGIKAFYPSPEIFSH